MASRVARTARRVARLLCVHRLHRARCRGDCRRRFAGAKPRRRSRPGRAGHPRWRCGVLADPPRGRRSGAGVSGEQGPRLGCGDDAGDGARAGRSRCARRDQGGRRTISALWRHTARSAACAVGPVRIAPGCVRRRRGTGAAGAARSRGGRARTGRRGHDRDPDGSASRARQARRRHQLRAASAHQRSCIARDRTAPARQPRALELPLAPARERGGRSRRRCSGSRRAQRVSRCRLGNPDPSQCLAAARAQYRALHAIPDARRSHLAPGRWRRRRQRGQKLPRSQARRDRHAQSARRDRPQHFLDLSGSGPCSGIGRHRVGACGRSGAPVRARFGFRRSHSGADRARAPSVSARRGAALRAFDGACFRPVATRARPRRSGFRPVPR
jgi:hypothetical protein